MERPSLSNLLAVFWWVLLLRGIIAILLGILAIAWPGATFLTLMIWFAIFALLDGAATLYHAFANRSEIEQWWLLVLEGIFGVLFGMLVLLNPEISTEIGGIILALSIAAWAIATGAMRLALAIRLRKEIEGEFWLGLSGALSIIFGLAVIAQPRAGLLVLLYLVAFWAIVTGMVLIILALRLRSLGGRLRERFSESA